jgi:hypothetical protein
MTDSFAGYIDPACPPELLHRVQSELLGNLSGKGIFGGDRLPDLVRRHCPHIFGIAEAQGFEVVVDLPENTHEALRASPCRIALKIRRRVPWRQAAMGASKAPH